MRSCLALALLAVNLAAPGPARAEAASPDHAIHYRDEAMGTVVDVTFWGDDQQAAAAAAQAAFAEVHRIDALMTTWSDASDIARVNRGAGGAPVRVDPEVFRMIRRALRASIETRGAFDITVGAFRGLWKFDQDRDGSIPDDEAIRARLASVGHRRVLLDHRRRSVSLREPGMFITLGGIAKGYAIDRATAILHERGFVDFILQAGGDLYVSGRRGDRKWRVGIRDPRGRRDAVFAVAGVENRTFSTSGDYERYVVVDGVRYHHILDPSTGRPAPLTRSVTVMAKDALTADIWSTALFVLGPERGMALVERRRDLEAVFVDASNELHVSSGLRGTLRVLKSPTDGP